MDMRRRECNLHTQDWPGSAKTENATRCPLLTPKAPTLTSYRRWNEKMRDFLPLTL